MVIDEDNDHNIEVVVVPVGCGEEFAFMVTIAAESLGIYNGKAEPELRRSKKLIRDLTFNVYGQTQCPSLRRRFASAVVEIEFNPYSKQGTMEVRTR